MKRLLVSALLAALVHAYWLRSNLGDGDGARPGKAPTSVVISLATTVRGPAPRLSSEPAMDAGPITQPRRSVPVTTHPVVKQRKGEPADANGSVDEDGVITHGDSFEPEVENDGSTADAPAIEHDDRPIVQDTPETKQKTNEPRQFPREEESRNTQQRSQAAKSRSHTAQSEGVRRKDAPATAVGPQGRHDEPGTGVSDDRGETQPEGGGRAERDTRITRTLEGMFRKARPLYKRNPSPPYPPMARRRGYEGTVIVRALVGIDGLVDEVRVDESSGHDLLDGAALQTVQRWEFEPALRGTETVEMWVRIPLRFNLQ